MRNNYEIRDVCERIKKKIRESRPRVSEDYENKLRSYALSSEEAE
jgi:thymidylate synthase ThyX